MHNTGKDHKRQVSSFIFLVMKDCKRPEPVLCSGKSIHCRFRYPGGHGWRDQPSAPQYALLAAGSPGGGPFLESFRAAGKRVFEPSLMQTVYETRRITIICLYSLVS